MFKPVRNIHTTLTFLGPCIITYSYRTTNKIHLFLKLFVLVKRSTCSGRSFHPSSEAQNCTHGNRHACCRVCSFELLMMDGKTSETCKAFYKNK